MNSGFIGTRIPKTAWILRYGFSILVALVLGGALPYLFHLQIPISAYYLIYLPGITWIALISGLTHAIASLLFLALLSLVRVEMQGSGMGVDGQINNYEFFISFLFLLVGGMTAWLIHFLQKLKAEANLTENRIRKLVHDSPAIMFFKDREGRYRLMSERALEPLGFRASDFLGKKDEEIFEQDIVARLHASDLQALEKGGVQENELILRHESVKRIYMESKFGIYDLKGEIEGVAGICIDLTERKKFEEERESLYRREREAREEAERAIIKLKDEQAMREQFVLTLTHDLRNPLTSAKASTEILMKSPERVEHLSGVIRKSLDRIEIMIRNLLDVTAIRAGKEIPLSWSHCDLYELIESTVSQYGWQSQTQWSFEGQRGLYGVWAPEGLRRMIENLLSNAEKYGDLTRPISVRLKKMQSGEALIEVHNYGPPIPQAQINRLLSRPQREENIMSSKKGWGLGLTLIRGIVAAHKGQVRVQADSQEGNLFQITLPTRLELEASPSERAAG